MINPIIAHSKQFGKQNYLNGKPVLVEDFDTHGRRSVTSVRFIRESGRIIFESFGVNNVCHSIGARTLDTQEGFMVEFQNVSERSWVSVQAIQGFLKILEKITFEAFGLTLAEKYHFSDRFPLAKWSTWLEAENRKPKQHKRLFAES